MENLEPFNPPDFTDRVPKVGEEDYITAELENRIKKLLLTNDAYLKGKLEELSEKSGIDLQTLTEKDKELKELFNNINQTLTTHTQDSNTHVSLTEKQNWNQAEENQNAFSSVNAGGIVIQSNGKTAQFSILAGTKNVTVSGDNAKKQIKISVSGGDADTLGGIDSSGFFRRYDLNQINIDNTSGCWSTDVSVNDGSKGTLPPDVAWCSVRQYVSQGKHFFAQIGQDFNHAKLFYRNRYLPTGTWSEWKFVGDGGNANKLGGKDASVFMQAKDVPSGISKLIDIKEEGIYTIYEGSTRYSDYPTFFKNLGFNYGLLEVIKSTIYIVQKLFAVPADGSSINYAICYINKDNNGWSGWKRISDGNAKTLDGIGTSGFFRRYNHPTVTSANTAVETGIHTCSNWTDIPSEATSPDSQGTIITINYNELGGTIGVNNIWLKQQFISPHNNGSFTRYVYGANVGVWRKDANETVINRLAHTNFFNYVQDTNLNTLLTTGCYQVGSSIYAKLSLNFPLEGVGGFLKVECNGNVRTQTYYAFAGKSNFVRVFYRHYFKNAETGEVYWSEWDEKISSQNVSNPNLLDNPDFKINQRGQTSYTASAQYTVDRWLHNTVDGFKVIPTNDGIVLNTLDVPDGTAKGTLVQYIEDYTKLLGKTVTISCKIKGISGIFKKEVVIPTSAGSTKALNIGISLNDADLFLYYNGSNKLSFNIRSNVTDVYKTMILEWVKLELGSCPTPFVPPNPALELLKCQRYYEYSNAICGLIFYGDKAFTGSQFKVEKRVIPTVKVTANLVGETTNFNVTEVGYPTAKGFTYAVSERSFPTLSPIYYYYVADAEIY